MNISPAIIIDVALIAVIVVSVFHYARKGFVAGLMDLVGNLASLALAWVVSGKLSPTVFENFFKNGMIDKTSQMISEGGQVSIQAVVDKLAAFLPDSLVQSLLGGTEQLQGMLDSGAPGVASQVVDQVIAPLFLPIISVVVFFVTFAIASVLINFLVSALSNLNRVPLMGGLNRTLGGVAGLVLGVVYVLLLLCAVWAVVVITSDGMPYFNTATLQGSMFYQFFSRYNPFV